MFFFFTIINLFKNYLLIPQYVDEIICLIRGRHLAYLDTYDVVNRIINLNFYNNFKDRYDDIRGQAGPNVR